MTSLLPSIYLGFRGQFKLCLCTDSGFKQKMATRFMDREVLTCGSPLPGMDTAVRLASFLRDSAKGCVQHTNKGAHFGEHIPHVRMQYPVKGLLLVQADEAGDHILILH
eukprot:g48254.t1